MFAFYITLSPPPRQSDIFPYKKSPKWTYPLSIGGMGCCIQVLGSKDSALRAELCMFPNIVILIKNLVFNNKNVQGTWKNQGTMLWYDLVSWTNWITESSQLQQSVTLNQSWGNSQSCVSHYTDKLLNIEVVEIDVIVDDNIVCLGHRIMSYLFECLAFTRTSHQSVV